MTEQIQCNNCSALLGHKLVYYHNMVNILQDHITSKHKDSNRVLTQDDLTFMATMRNGKKTITTIENYVLDRLNVDRQCCRMALMTSVDTSSIIH